MSPLAHVGQCSAGASFTTVGLGTLLGVLLFRPWRARPSARAGRWSMPVVVAALVTLGACGGGSSSSSPRPSTDARLEIVTPAPNAILPPTFVLDLNLIGAKVVPESAAGGPLRGDEGHIHVTLDGKLISMTYGTSQELKDLPAGPHNIQAEFVAADHAPFSNRVIVAVAFSVADGAPPT
ncbi:MAG: hypothetical protein ACLGI2_04965 [Acidimicrobiia bacterium]